MLGRIKHMKTATKKENIKQINLNPIRSPHSIFLSLWSHPSQTLSLSMLRRSLPLISFSRLPPTFWNPRPQQTLAQRTLRVLSWASPLITLPFLVNLGIEAKMVTVQQRRLLEVDFSTKALLVL